jgi:hypothetical protein
MSAEDSKVIRRSNVPVDLFDTILRLFNELRHPFPYADCRKLYSIAPDTSDGLIPDLDLYVSDLAGYCGRGHRIIRMSAEEFLNMKKAASRSFFEKHPEYLPLREFISEEDTPDLFHDLNRSEEMRASLLKICDLMPID